MQIFSGLQSIDFGWQKQQPHGLISDIHKRQIIGQHALAQNLKAGGCIDWKLIIAITRKGMS
jgi:hypothetical protein